MSNKFAGFCVTCKRQVGPGHGDLTRSATGAWVVKCGKSTAPATKAPARKSPKTPRKAGSCVTSEGIATVTRRDSGSDASALVGDVYRAGQRSGSMAGQVVVVVGAECYYESDEDNEDMGDMQGGGWRAQLYIRLATATESAPVLAAEEDRAAKITATKATKDAATKAWTDAQAAATAGLVQTECSPRTNGPRERLAAHDGCVLERETLPDGSVCIRLWGTVAFDMDISHYWGTEAQVAEWRLMWAREGKITRSEAAEWLEKYSGCSGADDYRALLTLLPSESVTS